MRKSILLTLIIVLIGGAISAWLFFSSAILDFMDMTGDEVPRKVVNTGATTVVETGGTQSWDPKVTRTQTIETASGETITISTNGPPLRPMTDAERADFERKFQESN